MWRLIRWCVLASMSMMLYADECAKHFPSGMPVIETDQLLCKKAFAIGYSYETQTPLWTSHVIDANIVKQKSKAYKFRFSDDEAIPEKHRAYGYRDCTGKSVYERGQLVPYEDIDGIGRVEFATETFLKSNVAPQLHDHNAKGWKVLEKEVRNLAVKHGQVEVVTGVMFAYGNTMPVMVGNGVMVPTHWYKAVYAPQSGRIYAWLMPHKPVSKQEFQNYRVRLGDIESKAGIDLFPALSDEQVRAFEMNVKQ